MFFYAAAAIASTARAAATARTSITLGSVFVNCFILRLIFVFIVKVYNLSRYIFLVIGCIVIIGLLSNDRVVGRERDREGYWDRFDVVTVAATTAAASSVPGSKQQHCQKKTDVVIVVIVVHVLYWCSSVKIWIDNLGCYFFFLMQKIKKTIIPILVTDICVISILWPSGSVPVVLPVPSNGTSLSCPLCTAVICFKHIQEDLNLATDSALARQWPKYVKEPKNSISTIDS